MAIPLHYGPPIDGNTKEWHPCNLESLYRRKPDDEIERVFPIFSGDRDSGEMGPNGNDNTNDLLRY